MDGTRTNEEGQTRKGLLRSRQICAQKHRPGNGQGILCVGVWGTLPVFRCFCCRGDEFLDCLRAFLPAMAAHFASPSFTSQDVGFRSCNLVLSIRDNRLCWNGHVGNLRRARTAVVAPLRMALCKVAGFGPNRTSSSFVAVGKTGFNEDRVEFGAFVHLEFH